MSCAIFCLLAICTFQTVFAQESIDDRIYDSQDECMDQMNDIEVKHENDLRDAARALQTKDISTNDMYFRCTANDEKKFNLKLSSFSSDKCFRCYEKAKNSKDIQSGKKCSQKLALELKNDAKLYLALAKICMAKCAKSAGDCRKQIAKLHQQAKNNMKILEQDIYESMQNNNLNTDASKKTKQV